MKWGFVAAVLVHWLLLPAIGAADPPPWVESALEHPILIRPLVSTPETNGNLRIEMAQLRPAYLGVRSELQTSISVDSPTWETFDTQPWRLSTNQLNDVVEKVALEIPNNFLPLQGPRYFRVAYIPTAPAIAGPVDIYPNPGFPPEHWKFFPDSKLSIVSDGPDLVQVYWGAHYRSVGPNWRELGPAVGVLEPGAKDEFDAGAVFMSIFRLSEQTLLGFYHAEDYTFGTNKTWASWKSIASCYSTNNGVSWMKRGRILTTGEVKPDAPTWGGVGDFCVVRDETASRWVCLFTGITEGRIWMSVAESRDSEGKPGTWFKYHNATFEEPGLGGRFDRLPGFEAFQGALQNPAIHWNRHLKRYVMLAQTNGQIPEGSNVINSSLYFSTSSDLIHWTQPTLFIEALPNERMWYPTVIDRTDTEAGREAFLVYAYEFPWWATYGVKKFTYRRIQFW